MTSGSPTQTWEAWAPFDGQSLTRTQLATPRSPRRTSVLVAAGALAGPHTFCHLSDSSAQASLRRARLDSPLLQDGAASASSQKPLAVPTVSTKVSKWAKVRNLHIQRAPTLDRAGQTWHSDPSESALKELLLGSRNLESFTIGGEHVPL